MKSLHIRDVPEPMIARLKRRARLHHRSLQGELIFVLEGEVVYRHADKLYPMKPGDSLFFDADGTGATAQVRFATLQPGATLVAADIFVI